jgi:ABC-type uncharacterized transport system substrate-binding protein
MGYIFKVIAFIMPFFSLAHPHVFIDNRVLVLFDSKGLKGFKHEWIFDEMFSSTIIQEFDLDTDRKFNKEEIKNIKKGAFSNLKEHNYFNDITINGKQVKIKEIKNFHAKIDKEVIIYEFFLPFEVVATDYNKKVKIAIYDPTYFVQVLWASKDPYVFEDTSKVILDYEIIKDEEKAYYYGQIIPEALKIEFRKKP